jgi:hypothetical protein
MAVKTSKLSQEHMIVGIAGIVLVISLFLSWGSVLGVTITAFDAFSAMDIIMLVIGIVAIAYAALAAGASANVPARAARLIGALGLLVVGWTLGWDLEFGDAGIGAWIALVAGAAIAYGGYRSEQALP